MAKVDLYPQSDSSPQLAQVQTGTVFGAQKKVAADVNLVGGAVNFKSPTGPFYITVATVTTVAANPIGAALTNRVSLSIRNKSAVNTVYFGASNTVTADNTATGGWEIGPQEDFNIDLDATNSFYLISTGAAIVKIMEIAST